MTHYVVIGAGIVGLATARALSARSGSRVTVLEKGSSVATHQTGRNSGVIHSGLYYRPGSAKAEMCRKGAASMVAFAREYGVPHDVCGKIIVATEPAELPQLDELQRRAAANGVAATRLSPDQARELEPHVSCLAALHVPSTGIIDYRAVCEVMVEQLTGLGHEVRVGTEVLALGADLDRPYLVTGDGRMDADVVVNCAGLHSDRVAAMTGAEPPVKIVPFRGEYYRVRPDRSGLVRNLIYPVPDPSFPFLGVHLTRSLDGGVHAGPNAVLALAREGYAWGNVSPSDIIDMATYPGLWHLGRQHWRMGLEEVRRSLSSELFARALQRLVPELNEADLVPDDAGVRAQALARDGSLIDDFLILRRGMTVHVLNAPSPAATSALEIGEHIARQVWLLR